MNDTTRRHPRTLHEAFPQDHADWISHHKRPLGERVADFVIAAALIIAIAVIVMQWGV